MIIKRPHELKNYHSERQQYLKARGRMSVELKTREDQQKLVLKKQSLSFMDSRKIKSRLSEIFKQQNELKRTKSTFHQIQDNKKSKNFREYFSKTFLRKKQRGSSFDHFARQKMQILNDESEKEVTEPAFKIKQLKLKRKVSPYHMPLQQPKMEEIYADRYYKVLSFAKSKFKEERMIRKPVIPEVFRINESRQIGNNFLNPRNKLKMNEQKSLHEQVISPWGKLEESEFHENLEQCNI